MTTTNAVTIRSFEPCDAATVARLVTQSVQHHWTYTPEQFRESSDPRRVRLVATVGEHVVATAAFAPFGPSPEETLRLDFAGEEAHFTSLYLGLLARVPPETTRLLGVTREDWPSMRFFHAAGFRNAWQSWGAHLDLNAFEFERFTPLDERLFLAGYEVERLNPDAPPADWSALHGLHLEGLRDAPRNPTTTLEELSMNELRDMVRREEVAFVMRVRGVIVASTRLTPRGSEVESEQTVTASAHRSLGVATVLKAHALHWAKAQGYGQAGTGGTVLNLPMLRVNAKLGYATEPMWVTWERRLARDA